jgi:hypothetical protein
MNKNIQFETDKYLKSLVKQSIIYNFTDFKELNCCHLFSLKKNSLYIVVYICIYKIIEIV